MRSICCCPCALFGTKRTRVYAQEVYIPEPSVSLPEPSNRSHPAHAEVIASSLAAAQPPAAPQSARALERTGALPVGSVKGTSAQTAMLPARDVALRYAEHRDRYGEVTTTRQLVFLIKPTHPKVTHGAEVAFIIGRNGRPEFLASSQRPARGAPYIPADHGRKLVVDELDAKAQGIKLPSARVD